METSIFKKRAVLYLVFLYGFLFIGWLLAVVLPESARQTAFTALWGLFSVFPVISTLLTRWLTHDRSPWYLRPNFRKSWKTYLLAAFLPGVAIFLSALLFYVLFPQDLDLNGRTIVERYAQFGAPETLQLTPTAIFLVGIAFIFISPLVLPVHLFALGEEIGWRGYLLPALVRLMKPRQAVLLHGLLWGVAHAPLIFFGFNYGSDYWGAPYTGMGMMVVVCIALGTWLAYVTLKSQSILPACLLHGTANVIGEMPLFFSLLSVSPLLGPNPTGMIGLSGLLVGAVILLAKLE